MRCSRTTQTGVTLSTIRRNAYSAQNPAVVFASGAQTATLRLTPVNNSARTQPYVIIDYGAGARAPTSSGGVALATPTGGPIGVVLVDDETGDIALSAGASFRPGQVSPNQEYRILFMTSEGGPATSTDIDDYDHFVRSAVVRNGGADMLPYAGFFKAFVSTATVVGREHVGIWDPTLNGGSGGYTDGTAQNADSGKTIYWLGNTSDRVMSSYWDFCQRNTWWGRWTATENLLRHEDGTVGDGQKVWTGMSNNCTTSPTNPLGSSTPAYGPGAQAGTLPLNSGTEAASNTNRFYAMSEEFKAVASAAMPRVNFTQSSYSGNEEADYTLPHNPPNNITGGITLRVTPASTQDLMIPYTVSSNDATAGEDFDASGGTVTIPAGQTTAIVAVPVIDDNKFEASEAIRIQLAPSPNYLLGSGVVDPRSTVLTIIDNEQLVVGFEQAEYWALEDSGNLDVNLTLDHETGQTVRLTLAVGGTATDGSDYTAPSTSVTIPTGNTSGKHTISIPIAADATQEADETITLRISNVSTARADKVSPDRTTVYIADQDHAANTLVVPNTLTVREGEATTYRLRLSSPPSGTVTVTISGQSDPELTLDADDAMNGDQSSVQFDATNWYVGRKITVRGIHDVDLTDDSVTLTHSPANGGYSATSAMPTTVDDEDVTLSIAGGAAVTEGTAAEFTVTANPAPDRNLTINLRITDATGADFLAAGVQGDRTRRLDAGETSATFEIATVADNTSEPSGTIGIAFRTSDHYSIDSSAASATVQVNDDDATAITVTMSGSDGDADGNAVEGAGNSTGYRTITIALGQALTSGQTVTVPLTVAGATVTTDYTFGLQPTSQTGVSLSTSGTNSAQNPAVVFTSGGQTATLRLTPVNNGVRTQPYVVIDYGTGSRAPTASGVMLSTPTGGPIGVVLVDDETMDIEVPATWALTPSGLSSGDEFRLIFLTSETRDATSTDIDVYNAWAQRVVARGGHASLLPYGGMARVVGSTMSDAARDNTGMWDSGAHADGSTTRLGYGRTGVLAGRAASQQGGG